MKVALSGWFWPRPETGSGQYLRHLVRALRRGHPDVALHLLAPPDFVEAGSLPEGVAFHPLPLPSLPRPVAKVWWEQGILPKAAARMGADLLHVPYWAPPMRSPLPLVVTIHDLIPLLLRDYRGPAAVRLYTAMVAAASRGVAQIVTDSEASRRDILAHLAVAPARVTVAPLAVGSEYRPTPSATDAAVLRRYGLEPGYLLYLGGFDRRKNLATLFAAFAIVREALPEARLVVAGRLPAEDSAFAPDPRRLMAGAGVEAEAVRFLGFVPEGEKAALYRGARLFAYPSRYEGFGLPPLEAMACGTPVVGSEATSLPEVVGAGGVLAAPDDVEGMAGAMIQLLIDDGFHAGMRAAALRQAARFSWERTASITVESYARALSAL